MDFASIALLLISSSTILYGCTASAGLLFEPQHQQSRPDYIRPTPDEQSEITPKFLVLMLVLSSGVLLIIFFFAESFLQFLKIIILFPCFVSSLFTSWDWFWMIFRHRLINLIVTIIFSIIIPLIWFITEHWLITNLITFCICVTGITFLKINSLKICVIVSICFVIYDVWWVFLSPLVFGKSVMVVAATSASAHIPATFSIPNGNHNSLIGAGDIVIPGLVLDFFMRYDLKRGTRYFEISFLGYFLGVIISWIMVHVMNHGQPALLWIFPSVLILTLSAAACNNELSEMWKSGIKGKTEEGAEERDGSDEVNEQLLNENNELQVIL